VADVYRDAGEMIGQGVPWDAVWSTPVELLDALAEGVARGRA
jgi:hypothetical protein